ncbi:MAG: hypothetical protein QXG65_01730 [Thermoplasmata archaeon]
MSEAALAGSSVPAHPPREPGLLRLRRRLFRVATVVGVVLVVYLGLVTYSATQLGVSPPSSIPTTPALAGESLVMATEVNLTNAGILPITGVSVTTLARSASDPASVGVLRASLADLGPGARATLPVGLAVTVAPDTPGQALLVENTTLTALGWLNATLGYGIPISISFVPGGTIVWTAPFSGYSVHVASGNPAPTTLSFYNGLSIPWSGALTLRLVSANGTGCGTATVALSAGAHGAVQRTVSIALQPATCLPAEAASSLTGSGYSWTLPEVPVQ